MSGQGEPKREWYTREKYNGDAAKFAMYEAVMRSYASALGFEFSWDGEVANTLDAHRVIQVFQAGGEEFDDDPATLEDGRRAGDKYGAAAADRILLSLYRQYFEEGRHPGAEETLLRACEEAGVEAADARRVVLGDRGLGRAQTQHMVRMAGINGVDSVPTVVLEGRRRDLTLVGAKEVEDYEKALATIVKEST
jgi:predicted DsbA family dithiol-disulfide isomerase